MDTKWSTLLISTNLINTLRPLLAWTFFFGLTPFRIIKYPDNATKRTLKLCPIGILNAVIIITIYISVYITAIVNCESFVGYFFKSKISMIGDALQTMTGFVGIGLIYASAILQKDKLVKMLHKISETGQRLEDLGVKMLHNKSRSFFYSAFGIMHLISLTYLIGSFFLAKLFMNGKNPASYVMIGFFLQYTIVSSSIVSFLCASNILQRRYGFLNSILKNLSLKTKPINISSAIISNKEERLELENGVVPADNKDNVRPTENGSATAVPIKKKLNCLKSFSVLNISAKLPKDIIQESMEVHFLLCEAATTANKYFTFQLLTIISISFLIIVFDAYYVLETCLERTERDENFKPAEFVTFFVCQMLLYIMAILAIVEGSVKAVNKSEKTCGIIHILLNQSTDPEVKEKLQNFSLQLIHQRVRFTAAGLFTIDRTLYFTITGAITTYLIILLQFST